MTTVVVKRPPRRPAPEIPAGELPVAPPPTVPEPTGSRWQQALQLLPLLTGAAATALLFAGRDGGTYAYVVGAVFGVSTLGMLATSWSGGGAPRRAELAAARREYLRHLAGQRRRARDVAGRQRAGLLYRHPDPGLLWSTVDSFRLWERRPGDPDFGVVRVGVGPQTLATRLVPPVTGEPEELEPVAAAALRSFLDTHSVVPDLPVAVSLRGFARLHVPATAAGRGLVRALLAQLTAFHAPTEVLVAVCAGPATSAEWEWVKWLPHALHPRQGDGAGPARLIAGDVAGLERLLGDLLADRPRSGGRPESSPVPHLVVVLDGAAVADGAQLATEGGLAGVTVLDLGPTRPRLVERGALVLDVADGGELSRAGYTDEGPVGRADRLGRAEAEALARRLAPRRLAPAGDPEAALAHEPDPAALLRIGDPATLDPARCWAPRPPRDRLRVPIGVGVDGHPVELDLKESAQDGMGPHGLLVGATGSGKSELLRTVVLGLAATHSPEILNLVLIDFKGGATFASLDRLPHTSALITNLVDELPLVDRATDALNGELVRRQELLRAAGNHASLREYERARAGGAALAPLPTLLVVCDEFSELLSAKPDFIDLFVQIGRVGRSLGVHLLLASQRLEEGRLRGLDTHLSYRLGLRTFSALESRSVLGVPDAYELPRSPGHGFLAFGTEPLTRFRAAYVSGAPRRAAGAGAPGGVAILEYRAGPVAAPPAVAPPPSGAAGPSLLDLVVDRLAGQGPPAHPVWLPPLADPPTLDELLGPVAVEPGRGLTAANPRLRGALEVPVGLVDRPFDQRRDLLWLRLDGACGHVAVVGAPQSGKSTLLRTLVTGLALTHTPAEAQVYCLDFGGGQLAAVRGLPHVGGVATRLEPAAVRRTVAEVAGVLAERERRFAELGVESMAAWRRRRAAGTGAAAEDRHGDVFLVVDGWGTLRGEYEELEPTLADLATRGLSYGVHLAASATRWLDFRPGVRDLFGSRLELRLGDPADSLVARRAAANVPERSPGRGLTADGLHLLAGVPVLTGGEDPVAAVAAAWDGPAAPPVRLLPEIVEYARIADDADPASPFALPIGLAETDLRPVRLDFAAEPHLLLFGDARCGKSSFLRSLAASIARRLTPEQARIILVDHRRSLLGAVRGEHLIGYGTSAAQTRRLAESVAEHLQRRLPGPDVTEEQLRDRSWWQGPDCFVLVDDYDLVAASGGNPLLALVEHLAQARDVGLHLVLARRSGGAARAMYEPLIQQLREVSAPGLVMAGDRAEGPLLGNVRPGPLPPGRGWLVTRQEGVRLVQLAAPPAT